MQPAVYHLMVQSAQSRPDRTKRGAWASRNRGWTPHSDHPRTVLCLRMVVAGVVRTDMDHPAAMAGVLKTILQPQWRPSPDISPAATERSGTGPEGVPGLSLPHT